MLSTNVVGNGDTQEAYPDAERVAKLEVELGTRYALTPELLDVERARLEDSDAQFIAWTFGTPLPQLNTVAIAELLINETGFMEAPFPLYLVKALVYESKFINYPPVLGPAVLFSPNIELNGNCKINFLLNGDLFIIDGNVLPDTEVNVNHLIDLMYAVSMELFIKSDINVASLNVYLENQPLNITNCQRIVISDYFGRPKDDSISKLIRIGKKV